jgi:hypothetical protein
MTPRFHPERASAPCTRVPDGHAPSIPRRITMSRMLSVVLALITLATAPLDARAQSTTRPSSRWGFLMSSGALIPTGSQRGAISNGALSAAQLSYAVRPEFALNATFGWARTRDRAAAVGAKLDVLTYDLGAELRAPRWFAGRTITFSPFAGAGVGARSDNYRHLDIDATHDLAVYGSVGGELGAGRVSLRLEARDNVAGFAPIDGRSGSKSRNDVALLAGLRLVGR